MIENSSETNFRSVTTNVTVNELHSVVRRNTELMHRYWVRAFAITQNHKMGIEIPATETGSLALAIAICSAMLLYSSKNPGNGNKCWKKKEFQFNWIFEERKSLCCSTNTYGNVECFAWMFSVLFVQHFLIDSHPSRNEQRQCEQRNAANPPEKHRKSARVFLTQTRVCSAFLKWFGIN